MKLKVRFTAQFIPCVVSFYVKVPSQITDNKLVMAIYVSSNTHYIHGLNFGFTLFHEPHNNLMRPFPNVI